MNFFYQVIHSVYDPDFYRAVLASPLRRSLRYFLQLALVTSLLLALILSAFLVPAAKRNLNRLVEKATALYPADLVISIQNGTASTSPAGIKTIPIPVEWNAATGDLKNILVIDLVHEPTPTLFATYRTAVLLSAHELMTYRDSSLQIVPLARFPNLVINQNNLINWANQAKNFVSAFLPVLPVIIFLGLLVYLFFFALYLFLVALLVWLVAWIRETKIRYGQAYQLSLHAATAPLLVKFFILWLFPGANFFLLPTILLLLVVALNLKPPRQVVMEEGV